MRFRFFLIILFFGMPTLFAGEWVLPWIASKDQEWSSEIVFNNHGSATVTISLQAVRPSGETVNTSISVPAASQIVRNARTIFPSFASGVGYCVFASASTETITMAVRVGSIQTASEFSPAMGEAVLQDHAATTLILPTMPTDGFSAPALVNLSLEETATVNVRTHGPSGPFGNSATITILPHRPWAGTVTSLFPGLNENVHLVATSNVPIVAANFSFNPLLEPSMINGVATPVVTSEIVNPLLIALDTSSTLSATYVNSTDGVLSKRACPDITAQINPGQAERYIEASASWGSGCTNAAGVYHSGSLGFTLARVGGVQGDWMSGTVSFSDFVTRYEDNDAEISGSALLEGSTTSQNFMLSADLTISGASSLFEVSGEAQLNAQLNISPSGSTFKVYGSLDAAVNATYNYTLSATVNLDDPLIYDYSSCSWPTDGRLSFDAYQSGKHIEGWIDFGDSTCNTAVISIYGREQTLFLDDIN